MNYNINSGYGQLLSRHLSNGFAGKLHIVGDGATHIDMFKEAFVPDPDGVVRFHTTIEAALGDCKANAGDTILVLPGHTETVSSAAAIDVDVAGVNIVGLGTGGDRPTFTIDSATGASFKVSSANATIENIVLAGGIDALTNPLNIVAADCTLKDIETKDDTGQAVDFIVTDANADRLTIDGWTHRGDTAAGAESAIKIVGGADITIKNFNIDGNFSSAAIENSGTKADDITIGGGDQANYIRTRNSADVAISLHSSATGQVGPNIYARVADDAANITEAVSIGTAHAYNPIEIVNADGERAMQWNGTQSTDA